ncbi:MAG: 23S rRNA (adenine(2503)-C(2))-methyltransferase RlmN [Gammaproteobacteria bacterium]
MIATRLSTRTNLLGLDRARLEAWFAERGEPAFRARQLMSWLYRRGESDITAMTDLAKSLREHLQAEATVELPRILRDEHATDETRKWLLATGSGTGIEMVYIPEPERGTLCVSSQVGCAMDCAFCATGAQGFNRNLDTAEIVAQVWLANKLLPPRAPDRSAVSNVVFMGMGEPLANYRNLVPALQLLTDPLGFGLSKRRVTVSTSGLVPAMDRLAEDCDVALAISLHAPEDSLRDVLVPINRRYPIAELMAACRRYVGRNPHRHITVEYVMLDGVNDSDRHARQLVRCLDGLSAKVNLIPFNPFPETRFRTSPQARIDRFRDIVIRAGYMTVTRRTRGDDISAACGQLAGQVENRVRHRLGARRHSVEVNT